MDNNQNNSTISDVLSGNSSLKLEVSINKISIVLIGVSVFLAVAIGVLIFKKM